MRTERKRKEEKERRKGRNPRNKNEMDGKVLATFERTAGLGCVEKRKKEEPKKTRVREGVLASASGPSLKGRVRNGCLDAGMLERCFSFFVETPAP